MSTIKVGVVLNNYTLVKQLGANSLGDTFLGEQRIYERGGTRSITKQYTIKTINLNVLTGLGLDSQTLEQEINYLKKISESGFCSKYIVCYYDSFVQRVADQSILVIVTDYIVGPSLQQLITEQTQRGNFEMPKLIQAMVEIAEAVDYIHVNGIAHQNIKPSNIIFNNATGRFILVDFAFSCSVDLNSQCKGKTGTVYYTPPELLGTQDPSQLPFTYRTAHDVWSMGVIFYQMANLGNDFMDFTSTNPQQISKEIQLGNVRPSKYPYVPINNVIDAVLQKEPSKRLTAGQVLILLQKARPLCIVNDTSYTREVTKAIIDSLNIDVKPETNDYELCGILTDHLATCKIGNNEYQKKQLIELAEILGVDTSGDSNKLCGIIQSGMQFNRDNYRRHVTEDIIQSVELMAKLSFDEKDEPLEKLEKHYTLTYQKAKELDLIDVKLLKSYQNELSRRSLVYTTNVNAEAGELYAMIAGNLAEIVRDNS